MKLVPLVTTAQILEDLSAVSALQDIIFWGQPLQIARGIFPARMELSVLLDTTVQKAASLLALVLQVISYLMLELLILRNARAVLQILISIMKAVDLASSALPVVSLRLVPLCAHALAKTVHSNQKTVTVSANLVMNLLMQI